MMHAKFEQIWRSRSRDMKGGREGGGGHTHILYMPQRYSAEDLWNIR